VAFPDLDIATGQQSALDNFVEAPSGHVNIFGCAKFGQTASRKLYPTFAAVAQLFRLSMLGTFKREEKMKNQMVLWFCRHAVFLGSLFASRTCEPHFCAQARRRASLEVAAASQCRAVGASMFS
jgi:hypothetical protein